jgi:3-methyladenine DNA glycosylase AlkD
MTADEVIAELRRHANPKNLEGQARFGIETRAALGIPVPTLRAIAKCCGTGDPRRDHALAIALWDSGIHEARHIAAMVEDPFSTDVPITVPHAYVSAHSTPRPARYRAIAQRLRIPPPDHMRGDCRMLGR